MTEDARGFTADEYRTTAKVLEAHGSGERADAFFRKAERVELDVAKAKAKEEAAAKAEAEYADKLGRLVFESLGGTGDFATFDGKARYRRAAQGVRMAVEARVRNELSVPGSEVSW